MKKEKYGFRKVGKVLVACAVGAVAVLSTGAVFAEEVDTSLATIPNETKATTTSEVAEEIKATEEELASVETEIEAVENAIAEETAGVETAYQNDLTTLTTEKEKVVSEIAQLTEAVDATETEIADVKNQVESLETQISVGEAEIVSLEANIAEPRMISHRGLNTVAPENTLVAFEKAIEDGFTEVETDVVFTKDNIPVLSHDTTINAKARNLDGTEITETVFISDLTYSELSQYDFGIYKGLEYSGTKITKFEDLLAYAQNEDRFEFIHAELKHSMTLEQKTILVNLINQYSLLDNVGILSFRWGDFADFNDLAPTMQLEVLGNEYTDQMGTMLKTLDNGQRNVVASVSARIDSLRKAVATGYDVYTWTINDDWFLEKFADIGMTAVLTDGSRSIERVLKGDTLDLLDQKQSDLASLKSQLANLNQTLLDKNELKLMYQEELNTASTVLSALDDKITTLNTSSEALEQLESRFGMLQSIKGRLIERLELLKKQSDIEVLIDSTDKSSGLENQEELVEMEPGQKLDGGIDTNNSVFVSTSIPAQEELDKTIGTVNTPVPLSQSQVRSTSNAEHMTVTRDTVSSHLPETGSEANLSLLVLGLSLLAVLGYKKKEKEEV